MSELRFDPLKRKWVVIAPERAYRPSDHSVITDMKDNKEVCPFCPGREGATTKELLRFNGLDEGNWSLRVVPNKYPAFRIEGELKREGYGSYDIVSGIGAHEVVIETPQHNVSLSEYTTKILYNIFNAFKLRIIDLRQDIRFRYIFAFKNYGFNAGATLIHPHSQIIAMPVVPDLVASMLNAAKTYFEQKERCLICDILGMEFRMNERIVLENADFVAICPFASSSPFETRIYPLKHSHDFTTLNDNELSALANIVKEIFARLDKSLNKPHINMVIHTSPPLNKRPGHPEYWNSIFYDYHWFLEIIPRISGYAGFEWATGFNINMVEPEEAAKFLKFVSVI